MGQPLKMVMMIFVSGVMVSFLSACSISPFFQSLFDQSRKDSVSDARLKKAYPELKAMLRDNHFRQALALISSWENVRGLSDDNRRLLKNDRNTICMVGSSFYMGVARERRKAGHLRGALEALETARSFTPKDPVLRTEIERTKAQMIVSGQEGGDWEELLRKLLVLKAKNPGDTAIDPTIGWAYGKLSESEYVSGRYPLALEHAKSSLEYEKNNDVAMRVLDRISMMVRSFVDRAEQAYRDHRYLIAQEYLEKALTTDPHDKRARKDWRILSETPGGLPSKTKMTLK